MKKKNVNDILDDYFDSQKLNFLEHLNQQDLNLQNHFKMLENLFSPDSNIKNIEQNLKEENNKLDINIKSENSKFKKKLEEQKIKTNNLLSGTNVYIPDNNNHNINIMSNRNRRRINNISNNSNDNKDKIIDYKKSKAISALPTFQYKYIIKYEKRNEKVCSICLNEFKEEEILIRFSCKQHIFHKNCLCTWLKNSDICPLCKKSLIIK